MNASILQYAGLCDVLDRMAMHEFLCPPREVPEMLLTVHVRRGWSLWPVKINLQDRCPVIISIAAAIQNKL